jgi:molybdenum cofactor biosynthesis enzyme MoaA
MFNPHLNPMTPEAFENDRFIPAMRANWASAASQEPFALGRLRISLTQKCNFGCPFCYNEGSPGVTESLTLDDLAFLLDAAAPYVKAIKLTGGEPLAHRGFDRIAALCSARRPTTLTTNGSLLTRHIEALAWMTSVTVSVQSLDPARYRELMGTDHPVSQVISDISSSIAATGTPFQINCVLTRDALDGVLGLCHRAQEIGVSQVNLLGMLKLSEGDIDNFVPYEAVAEMVAREFGEPVVSTSTRLRFCRSPDFAVELVYQYCSVGCDVCRSDGFIRVDPTLALSYCLAAPPIPIRSAVKSRDTAALSQAFAVAVGAMGSPNGHAPLIIEPRTRHTSAKRDPPRSVSTPATPS